MTLGDGYHVGDCRELLRQLPDGCAQTCVTSPPYWGLRDYGVDGQIGLEATPVEYVAAMVEVFREVRRVLRDDGTVWLNIGDAYASSPSGGDGAKSSGLQGSKESQGVFRKSAAHKKVPAGLKPKDLIGLPWMLAFALRDDGWWLRQDIIWSKPNPMPESVADRCTKAHEYLFLLSKRERYYYDADAIAERTIKGASGSTFTDGKTGVNGNGRVSARPREESETRNRRSVWTIATQPTPDAHFATFPRGLVEPCILAGSRGGGLVLDPFGGSGTVGRVAEDLGRRWILFDLNPAYAEIARRKTAQLGLLGRCKP